MQKHNGILKIKTIDLQKFQKLKLGGGKALSGNNEQKEI